MKDSLAKLRTELCDVSSVPDITDRDWDMIRNRCVIVLPAGGASARMGTMTQEQSCHKSALRLSDGTTMIERVLHMYRSEGFRNFVVLVYHYSDSIKAILGDGSQWDVTIDYSVDPDGATGRGVAIMNAYKKMVIPYGYYLIVHNSDDQIVHYPGSFPRFICGAHLNGASQGMLATAVAVNGSIYPYTGMRIKHNAVCTIETYPFIPIPSHAGITVFSPEIAVLFDELFKATHRSDFEQILFSHLVSEHKLYAVMIDSSYYIPVNDPRALNLLETEIGYEGSSAR